MFNIELKHLRTAAQALFGVTILVAVVRWGGTARPGPLFVAGVTLLTALLVAFGVFVWWLYRSPIQETVPAPGPHSLTLRQIIAVLGLVAVTSFVIGGFWDEAWHRRYGGFGNDFLWPPHFLLYLSIGLFALFAAGGLLIVLRGRGSLRARFRAEPLLGLLGIVAAYLVASLPSDELWHRIYGKDLTAWSLPHIVLACGVATIALTAAAVQSSLLPRKPFGSLRGLGWRDAVMLGLASMALVIMIQLGVTEWDGAQQMRSGDVFRTAFWQRPVWLYPVVITTIAAFGGSLALQLTRRRGTATIVGLVVLAFRVACLAAIGDAGALGMGWASQLMLLVPLVALDLWYATHDGDRDNVWVGAGIAAALAMIVVGLPSIRTLLVYPPVTIQTVPMMAVMSLVMGLAAAWSGTQAGRWLRGLDDRVVQAAPDRWAIAATVGGAAVTIALALVIFATAQPPV